MRKKIEWLWERLDEATWRAKVIGGWLVKTEYAEGKLVATSMTFIPDRDHEWAIAIPKPDIQVERSDIAKDFEPSPKI